MKAYFIAATIAVVTFVTYVRSPVTHSPDSRWVLPTAYSLVTAGDIGLNEYKPVIKSIGTYGLRKKRGEYLNFFPVGPALLAAPFVWMISRQPALMSGVFGVPLDGGGGDILRHRRTIEHLIASVIGALAAAACFLAVAPLTTLWGACAVTAGVAWGSSLWSVGARGLWQHGPAMLALFCALALVMRSGEMGLRGRDRWIRGVLLGAFLGFAYLCRPTSAIGGAAIGMYLLRERRSFVLPALLGGFIVLAPFAAQNLFWYHRFLSPYYRGASLALTASFPEALLANLFSPSRGLFILSSWTALAFLQPRRERSALTGALWLWCAAHLVVVSLFDRWWAGHSFGPRFMSEVIPPLALLAAGAIQSVERWRPRWWAAVWITIVVSAALHAPGALSYATVVWNVVPRNIDDDPHRVWSVRGMQSLAPLMLNRQGRATRALEEDR